MWDSLTNLGVGPGMGVTAENVAEKYGVTRLMQDEYALSSQKRAVAAQDAGKFKDEIIPITLSTKNGDVVVDTDEYPKRDVTLEKLQRLKATFKEGGTVTAGNASGMNDAAASGVLLVEEEKAKALGLPILARIVSTATTGVEPEYMGIGPISSSQKALEKAGLGIPDMDLFEINEAFASQCIAVQQELGIDPELLNVNGGGISLGPSSRCTGSRLVVSLLHEMKRRNSHYGLAALCAGGGMGTTVIIENVENNK